MRRIESLLPEVPVLTKRDSVWLVLSASETVFSFSTVLNLFNTRLRRQLRVNSKILASQRCSRVLLPTTKAYASSPRVIRYLTCSATGKPRRRKEAYAIVACGRREFA